MKRKNILKNIIKVTTVGLISLNLISCQENSNKEENKDITKSLSEEESNNSNSSSVEKKSVPEKGSIAPELNILNIENEEKPKLEELTKEKPVLIDFFATNCSACRVSIPDLNRLYKEQGDKINIIGITAGETKESLEAFKKEMNIEFPLYLDDEEATTNRNYFVRFVPTMFVIDTDGKIKNIIPGAVEYNTLLKAINE